MKPLFKDLSYDQNYVCFPIGGNEIGRLQLLATIQLREKNKKELAQEKKDYKRSEKIYNDFINLGQLFIPIGERATKNLTCKITYIHPSKELVTWKQIDCPKENKPAAGKWRIQSFITLYKGKKIDFINP